MSLVDVSNVFGLVQAQVSCSYSFSCREADVVVTNVRNVYLRHWLALNNVNDARRNNICKAAKGESRMLAQAIFAVTRTLMSDKGRLCTVPPRNLAHKYWQSLRASSFYLFLARCHMGFYAANSINRCPQRNLLHSLQTAVAPFAPQICSFSRRRGW